MRKLNIYEIETFAKTLDFTIQDAKHITDIFFSEKERGNYRIRAKLDCLTDYIQEWECNWYRYKTWDDLICSEIDQGPDGLTVFECFSLVNKAIFLIPTGLFIQTVF